MEIPPEVAARIGTIIDRRYRLLRVLGVGGMGAVYESEHVHTGQHSAVKLMLPGAHSVEALARFLRETKLTARLQHPNIVAVLDAGQDPADGALYLVQELLKGDSLREVMTRYRQVPPALAVAWILPVLDALEHAHQAGVVHRDVKPENIFRARDGLGGVDAKLLDFGVARDVSGTSGPALTLTKTGSIVGTIAYQAPEQLSSAKRVGPQADVWACGIVLYEMLAGRLPWDDGPWPALVAAVAIDEIPRVETFASSTPAWLAAVVRRALERDAVARFQTAREMAGVLVGFGSR